MKFITQLTALSLGLLLSVASSSAMNHWSIEKDYDVIHNLAVAGQIDELVHYTSKVPKGALMYHVILKDNVAVLESLVQEGVLDITEFYLGRNALHWSAYLGSLKSISYLVETLGTPLDQKDLHGITPLEHALNNNRQLVVNYILDVQNTAPAAQPVPQSAKAAAKPRAPFKPAAKPSAQPRPEPKAEPASPKPAAQKPAAQEQSVPKPAAKPAALEEERIRQANIRLFQAVEAKNFAQARTEIFDNNASVNARDAQTGLTPFMLATYNRCNQDMLELLSPATFNPNFQVIGQNALVFAILHSNCQAIGVLIEGHNAKRFKLALQDSLPKIADLMRSRADNLPLRALIVQLTVLYIQENPFFAKQAMEGSRPPIKESTYTAMGLATNASPYQVLGIAEDASEEAIKKAFRMATLAWHPDRWPADRLARENKTLATISEAFQLINWANEVTNTLLQSK